jgi:VanZ family protein
MRRVRTVFGLAFAAVLVAVVVLSLLPGTDMPSIGVSDKTEHFAAYALLGFMGGVAFPTRRAATLLIVLLPALGIALELAQFFAPGRSPDVLDAVAGGTAACLALVPMLLRRRVLATSG